jgi:hypothetical protein
VSGSNKNSKRPGRQSDRSQLRGTLPNPDTSKGKKRSYDKMVYDIQALRQESESGPRFEDLGVPALARLEIPVRDVSNYRDVADKLRQLANTLDAAARMRDRPDASLALEVTMQVRMFTQQFKRQIKGTTYHTSSSRSGQD